MPFISAQVSLPGARSCNEDTVFSDEEGGFFLAAVADGLGGHGGGSIASSTAVETVASGFFAGPSLEPAALNQLFVSANNQVYGLQSAQTQMKTTLAALFSQEKNVVIAHVGDSRVYWFRGGAIIFQTCDHSVPQMEVLSGAIRPEQIRHHADRARLLRALGRENPPKPEFHVGTLQDGDVFLLCSDGFWEPVWEGEMLIDLSKSRTPQEWLSFMTARIGAQMTKEQDNFSAVALFYRA
ncbi:MAG TPA: serine/threonine-protein phosphatase [Candidatus Gallacutalibacter stercoravium]|nr:serine/threonine-protein phosphatase [Candidatus Gallacutalibacter stercoravium]